MIQSALERFVLSRHGLALDRLLVKYLGTSLTIGVFARATGSVANPALYLETRGRRSGRRRGVVLPRFEIDGMYFVVGSKGGSAEDPYWAKNLRATPEATVYIDRKPRRVLARFLQGEERDRYWTAIKQRVPAYRDYEQSTRREIPVVHFIPAAETTAQGL
ncbi:nitroreductase/quinone reductase family protein [Parahaliea mediterranea]|uniref:Nitroreductase family deazaflavin-dependent oxidoreductase n=1 Tax=Parahaliea mediterranea TaxID=651086 RepID=A0A939DCV4_9GAMM|nr:nitroreductase/quinone reductase family protein [Parahaliea mediterranea]MBN7795739.1 nitroreductase family deazaflavin-dependent oxidoreductase [Parahaliea mediterranea]